MPFQPFMIVAVELAEGAVFLPMYGKGQSMNVPVALGIVVYHVVHGTEPK